MEIKSDRMIHLGYGKYWRSDEIVGLLATCLLLPADPRWLPVAFVLFRFFDIAKPWPIRDVDHRLGGGIGIMLDDILAAAFAAICLLLARLIPIL